MGEDVKRLRAKLPVSVQDAIDEMASVATSRFADPPRMTDQPIATGELKPCPFCGGQANTVESDGHWYAACMSGDCFCAVGEGYDACAMPDHCFDTEEVAIAAWNRRASPLPNAPSGAEIEDALENIFAAGDKWRAGVTSGSYLEAQAKAVGNAAQIITAALDKVREECAVIAEGCENGCSDAIRASKSRCPLT